MNIKRISVTSNGTQANGQSGSNSISYDGRYIPFESNATNLVPNDLNGHTDTFIYDTLNETVELISLAPDGTQANGSSSSGDINRSGDYVTFASFADNLVANDTNGQRDIFVYDRLNQTTELISIATDDTQANGLSLFSAINANGNIVAFESIADNLVANDTNGQQDIFVRDRANQITRRIRIGLNGAQANGASSLGSVSNDGRYISFSSTADNLVAGDTNGNSDVFVYDRVNQTTELVSMGLNNAVANDDSTSGFISGDGLYVVYESTANNLVAGDTNGNSNIFVYDRVNQTTELIDLAADGTLSNDNSHDASISDDGRYVAFLSQGSNLVAGDTNGESNVFIRDRTEQTTELFDADSFPILSGDGQSLVFNSSLNTLVPNDTNDTGDVFLVDLTSDEDMDDSDEDMDGSDDGMDDSDEGMDDSDEGMDDSDEGMDDSDEDMDDSDDGMDNSDDGMEDSDDGMDDSDDGMDDSVIEEDDPVSNFSTDEVHRFFQFEKGFHFYTANDNEIEVVRERSAAGELSYNYEAEQYTVLRSDRDTITGETLEGVEPVYRFFNTQTGAHIYTNSENERSFIDDTLPNYNFEGIAYYAFESEITEIETIPVFRLLNNDSGSHFYTTEQNELDFIQENLPNFSLENNGNAVFHVLEL